MPVRPKSEFNKKKLVIAIVLGVVGIGGAGLFISKGTKNVPKPGDLTAGEKVALVAEVLNTDEEGVPEELTRARVAREQAAGGYYDEASGRMQDPSALFARGAAPVSKGSSLDLRQADKKQQKGVSSQDLTPKQASAKPLFEAEKLGGFGSVQQGGLQFAKPGQLAFGKQRPQRPGQGGGSGGSGGGGNIQWQQRGGGRRDSSQVPLQVAKADVGKQSAKGMTEVGGGKKMAGSKKLAEEQQRVARGEGGTGLMGAIKRGITTMKSAFGIGAETGTGESARFWHSGENAQQIASAGGQAIATIPSPGGNIPIDLGGDGGSGGGGGGGPTPGPGGPEGHTNPPSIPTVNDETVEGFYWDEDHCGLRIKVQIPGQTEPCANIQRKGWDIGGDGPGSDNTCYANVMANNKVVQGAFATNGLWDPTIYTVYIYHYESDTVQDDWTGYSRLQFRGSGCENNQSCCDINGNDLNHDANGGDIEDCNDTSRSCVEKWLPDLEHKFELCMKKCCLQPPGNMTTNECGKVCREELPRFTITEDSVLATAEERIYLGSHNPKATCEFIRGGEDEDLYEKCKKTGNFCSEECKPLGLCEE